MRFLILVLASLTLLSFHEPASSIDKKLLCKTWVPTRTYDTYKSCRQFKTRRGGIKLNEDGTLIKKQNSHWCGTPPISYEKVSGHWRLLDNSKFEITYSNWRGAQTDTFLIKNISKDRIKMFRINGY